jgi:hypothetical protein
MTLNRFLPLILILGSLGACKISSSFQPGTTGNLTASSILIPLAENQAAQGPTSLSIDFSEKMRDYYQSNSKLIVNSTNVSDLELYLTISDYFARQVQNTATNGGTATQMELIVNVKVRYIDNDNPTNSIENKMFSQKLLYSAELTLDQAQEQILPDILDLLAQEIFNSTLARW